MKKKTTVAQFKMFQEECLKWQKFFGLMEWKLYFDHCKLDDLCGQVRFNVVDGVATISMNTEAGELGLDNDFMVRQTAFHEICELLLARLEQMAGQRYDLNELEIREESHRIIRRLENSVFQMEDTK